MFATSGRVQIAIGVALSVALVTGCATGRPNPSASGRAPAKAAVSSDPATLAAAINRAQAAIDDPATAPDAQASAALVEQLASRRLSLEPRAAGRATLARLNGRALQAMDANLAAAFALSAIATRPPSLPHWRIVQPPPPDTLRRYFSAAQARYAVPWQDLAAIEFIETRFGRVSGVSSAGARGPMQFLPSTWARYGRRGRIDDPRDAIMAAARFLVANGARRNIAGALYAYNNSTGYVNAVLSYARWMRTDPRAYYGYYYWRVIFDRAAGAVILPLGYPTARPIPIR